ncbi:MAG: phenylacetate-CoA oxygenase subunit PaaC [Bacteroidetes bacterium]|nr:phenylacetate-CoA oxygenase subunit PaaC [Bacteroidota bacterium]
MEAELIEYCTRLADTSLIVGQRLTEWCGHGPILEEDIALSNIALDLIGQSRLVYAHVSELKNDGTSEDDIAFGRDANEFKNFLLAEQTNGDFGKTILRQYLISVYQYHQYTLLQQSTNQFLSAFAAKSLKEVTYHVRHSGEWVLRLGDGTDESHLRMQTALNELWLFTDDLFDADQLETTLADKNIAANIAQIKDLWTKQVTQLLTEATLTIPVAHNFLRKGSRKGIHTEQLGYILAEMQFLYRAYPGAKW